MNLCATISSITTVAELNERAMEIGMIFPAKPSQKKKTTILASQMDQTFTSFFSPVLSPIAQNLMG